jgi:hypothetical protein
MPSRLGSPNKDKLALRDMAAKHGVDVIEIQVMICADLARTYNNEIGKPRSRRSRQFFDTEDKLIKVTSELTPYFQGKLSNVTVTDETPRITVIRSPETIPDSQAWLDKYKPKAIDAKPVLPMERNVRKALALADAVGGNIGAAEIFSEAGKTTKDDQ